MTTIAIILKVLPYVACAAIPSFFFIKNNIKKNKGHKEELEGKDKTIKSLRDQIRDMALLEGEKNNVETNKRKIKRNISNNVNITRKYNDKLRDMPTK